MGELRARPRATRARDAASFDILEDETRTSRADHTADHASPPDVHPASPLAHDNSYHHRRGDKVLQELPNDAQTLRSRGYFEVPQQRVGSPDPGPSADDPIRIPRQRPLPDPRSFEPAPSLLDAPSECLEWEYQSSLVSTELVPSPASNNSGSHPFFAPLSPHLPADSHAMTVIHDPENRPAFDTRDIYDDPSVRHQIEKHLAGQFEWRVTYPPPDLSRDGTGRGNERATKALEFGCNLLWQHRPCADDIHHEEGHREADRYMLIATELKENAGLIPGCSAPGKSVEDMATVVSEYLTPEQADGKAPSTVEIFEHQVSRSPSLSGDHHGQRGELPASPRIEDSLAELDNLEDEIEAVGIITRSGRTERTKPSPDAPIPYGGAKGQEETEATNEAAQPARLPARVSIKPGPSPGRSSQGPPRASGPASTPRSTPKTPAGPSSARSKTTKSNLSDLRPMVKSTKPLTVPKFQLPGEAVAQRLREQREARQAQQAEAAKAQAAVPTRTRSTKPLTRPTFELPGEAISRRKREEREAKLKAQEEEERKRREFKARPMRSSLAPATMPRETIASRARRSQFSSEDSTNDQEVRRLSKRFSTTDLASSSRLQVRGRNSMAPFGEGAARTRSTSTAVSDKRSSVSAEEASQLRARGKEIYARDNSFSKDRERERREREALAKAARQEAAERSRAASREWAERQRQRARASVAGAASVPRAR